MHRFFAIAVLVTGVLASAAHGRPSMGRAGGGGGHHAAPMARPAHAARPQMPQARPAMPQARPQMPQTRPAMPQARPQMPQARPQTPQFQRPSVGSMQRPNLARPSFPNAGAVTRPAAPAPMSRPGLGGIRPTPGGQPPRPGLGSGPASLPGGGFATKPAPGLRPGAGGGLGGGAIGGGGRPGVGTLPGTGVGQPGLATRPTPGVRPGLGAATKPFPAPGMGGGQLGGNRPGRPGIGTTKPMPLPGDIGGGPGNRPGLGGNRPGIGGNRPGIGGNRPGIGGDRPGLGGNRPTTLPGDLAGGNRPGGGWNRPDGGWNRPDGGWNRPGIGGNRPGWNRPGIGDNNNFWNSGNININNGWQGGGWGYPGWGGSGWGSGWNNGYGGWNSGYGWNHGYVNPHYGNWYNGSWNNGWGNNWWGGFAAGAATWGLASAVTNWGLGYGTLGYAGNAYVNPYYSAIPATVVAASPYDYSQPVVATTYAPVADETTAQAAPATAGDTAVDAALEQFKAGDYAAALAGFDAALKTAPNDTVIHEVRALALFALGRYPEAAATLNSVLASAPGMDWTTVSNLYPSVDVYTAQLRKLEDFCKANPGDPAAHFVLAYHYLVGGHSDAAASALRVVVAKQPGDMVAKRILEALKPAAEAAPAEAPQTTTPAAEPPAAPETDLVGTWKATSDKDTVVLEITADSKFMWKATPAGKPALELAGTIETAGDAIALTSEKAGTMVGKVAAKGPDAFEFSLPGAPAEAKPLLFQRQK